LQTYLILDYNEYVYFKNFHSLQYRKYCGLTKKYDFLFGESCRCFGDWCFLIKEERTLQSSNSEKTQFDILVKKMNSKQREGNAKKRDTKNWSKRLS
jgi:hypothetical protein